MRSIWKGSIAFGLVNVPVRAYSATEDHDVELHQVHDKDGGRIRYQRRCEVCGKEVDYEHVDRAYQEGAKTVVLTEEDLKSLPEARGHEIDVLQFVPSEQIDPIRFSRSYFLAPDENAVKAYTLLRRALEDTEQTAVVQFTLRQKTRLGALRVNDRVMVLHALLWDDEVREADFPVLDSSPKVSAKERDMAASLVKTLSGDFAPDQFTDEYQQQLKQLVEAKLKHGDALDTEATFGEVEETDAGGEVVDLMEALRQSVTRSREKSGQGSASTTTKKPPSSTRKKTTKKTASKTSRASAKKSGTGRQTNQSRAKKAS